MSTTFPILFCISVEAWPLFLFLLLSSDLNCLTVAFNETKAKNSMVRLHRFDTQMSISEGCSKIQKRNIFT